MGLGEAGRKPRLLIILNRFVIGGQAVDTIPLAFELQKDFDLLIVYGEKEKDEIEPGFLLQEYPGLHFKKVNQLRRNINPFVDLFAFFLLLNTILRFKADIVHTHGAKSGFLGRLAAFCAGVPVIVHTFHGHFFHSYFSSWMSRLVASMERLIGKTTTAAIALSNAQLTDLVQEYKILPVQKLRVIPLGFHYNSAVSSEVLRQQFRQQYGLHESDVAIGIVGRIVPVKNHSFFVEIIKEHQQRFRNATVVFFVIGDGELKQKVQSQLNDSGIQFTESKVSNEIRVVFTSWLQHMDEVMSGLDIVVLTSLNEGTPVSMIEAQYFKRPVICTNVGGVKDTMEDGKTGYLIGQGNVNQFVDRVEMLIKNPSLRYQMGEYGQAFVKTKFSKIKETNATREFYFSLLRQKCVI